MNRDRHTKFDMLKAQDSLMSLNASDSQRPIFPGHKPSLVACKSSKKRRCLPEDEPPLVHAEINMLYTSGANAGRVLKARKESPWDSYREVLNLDLNGPVTVAERNSPHSGLVAIKVFPSTAAEMVLYRHQQVKHDNIVNVLDAFTTETSLYIVLEHLPISLMQIVEGPKYPTEQHLAAILQQVRYVQYYYTLADNRSRCSMA